MVEKIYRDKSERLETVIHQVKRHSRACLSGKLLSFLLAVCCLYLLLDTEEMNYLYAGIAFLALYLFLYVKDDRCQKKIGTLQAQQKICRQEIASLQGDFSPFCDGEEYRDPQHEFALDLDLFGKDSLYQRIDRTVTEGGRRKLARRFKEIERKRSEIEEDAEAVAELAAMTDFRIRYQARPYVQSELKKAWSDFKADSGKHPLLSTPLPHLSVLLTLSSIVLAACGILSWSFFSLLFLLQLAVTVLIGKRTSWSSLKTEKVEKEFASYQAILKDIADSAFTSTKLKSYKMRLFNNRSDALLAYHRLSTIMNLFEQRNGALLYLLLNGTLLFDIFLLKALIKWKRQYMPYMLEWIDIISEFDALVSLSTYSANHPENCRSGILEDSSDRILEAEGIYHPFLEKDKAVPNDFSLRRNHIAIVTGANMAGKSTFLRTIGVNYILAANGVPVCARSFRFSRVSLFSSMRTSDNLSEHVSYFNAELLRLKQLLAHIKTHPHTLIILDEILKGTNSKDKLEGSLLFLREMQKYPVSALIATHDLELSRLENESSCFENYRFEIALSENIVYSYKIERGVAQNLNASYLLSRLLLSSF